MVEVKRNIIAEYPHYMNNCLFHPTDAIEDPWGKRIIDTMANDGGIDTIRIYNMLEDIVYTDDDGNLMYDFRLNDLRLDYLVEKGFNVLIAYAAMPDCISRQQGLGTSVSKNKTRYKGKLFNTSAPSDYAKWEEVCYQYTKHIVERYGIERVSKWKLQCFNEADWHHFFLSDLPANEKNNKIRLKEYIRMYECFANAVTRVSEKLCIGGPALALDMKFLEGFLNLVKEKGLRLDYIAVHCYGTHPELINSGEKPLRVSNIFELHDKYSEIIKRCGFSETPLVYDEWGAVSHGFFNVEECPEMLFRENEKYSAFFIRMLHGFVERRAKISKMMICLSGQHEMVTDFSGFRNFFTLNFIKKPIYNAHRLTSMLGDRITECNADNENMCAVSTKDGEGYAVIVAYCTDDLSESLPDITETLKFNESIIGKKAEIFIIDKTHTNPYRIYEKWGREEMEQSEIAQLRREGELKPVYEFICEKNEIEIPISANGVFLCRIS